MCPPPSLLSLCLKRQTHLQIRCALPFPRRQRRDAFNLFQIKRTNHRPYDAPPLSRRDCLFLHWGDSRQQYENNTTHTVNQPCTKRWSILPKSRPTPMLSYLSRTVPPPPANPNRQESRRVRLLCRKRDPNPERARAPQGQGPLQVRPHARARGAGQGGGAREARVAQGGLPGGQHHEPLPSPGEQNTLS